MILGNGLIANAFAVRYHEDPDLVIFAQGVSDSRETDAAAFTRERRLLEAGLDVARGPFVYFSSCAAGDPAQFSGSSYLRHKSAMEQLVMSHSQGTVFRLPQVIGRTGNLSNLANYLYHHISEGLQFQLWSRAERNLVDVEDVVRIAANMIDSGRAAGKVTPIAAAHSIAMPDLVVLFEEIVGRHAVYSLVEAGSKFSVDAGPALACAAQLGLGLDRGTEYTREILTKYYANR